MAVSVEYWESICITYFSYEDRRNPVRGEHLAGQYDTYLFLHISQAPVNLISPLPAGTETRTHLAVVSSSTLAQVEKCWHFLHWPFPRWSQLLSSRYTEFQRLRKELERKEERRSDVFWIKMWCPLPGLMRGRVGPRTASSDPRHKFPRSVRDFVCPHLDTDASSRVRKPHLSRRAFL